MYVVCGVSVGGRAQQLRAGKQASCLCRRAWDKDGASVMREFAGHTGVW